MRLRRRCGGAGLAATVGEVPNDNLSQLHASIFVTAVFNIRVGLSNLFCLPRPVVA